MLWDYVFITTAYRTTARPLPSGSGRACPPTTLSVRCTDIQGSTLRHQTAPRNRPRLFAVLLALLVVPQSGLIVPLGAFGPPPRSPSPPLHKPRKASLCPWAAHAACGSRALMSAVVPVRQSGLCPAFSRHGFATSPACRHAACYVSGVVRAARARCPGSCRRPD